MRRAPNEPCQRFCKTRAFPGSRKLRLTARAVLESFQAEASPEGSSATLVAMAKLTSERELTCPCCGAVLTVDLNLGRIVSHEAPANPDRPELDNAQKILAEQAARRDALFEQSFQHEQNKGDLLAKRFEEALREAKKEPVSKPLRGFDLD